MTSENCLGQKPIEYSTSIKVEHKIPVKPLFKLTVKTSVEEPRILKTNRLGNLKIIKNKNNIRTI